MSKRDLTKGRRQLRPLDDRNEHDKTAPTTYCRQNLLPPMLFAQGISIYHLIQRDIYQSCIIELYGGANIANHLSYLAR